jgi:hypothetical protein
MEQEQMNKVFRKLSKLKNFYEGAKAVNNENEANVAEMAIQKLLAEYNLSMDEIESVDETEKKRHEVKHEAWSGYTYKSIGGVWEQRLTYVICKWNFCHCYTLNGSYKQLIVVGEPQNIETVRWLVDMLKERFVTFSKDRYKEYKDTLEEWEKPMSKDKFQRSYLAGAAAGLDAKLQEEHNREKAEEKELTTRISALVVRKDAAIKDYVQQTWGGAKRGRRFQENNDAARWSGYADGKHTSINKPIAGGRAAAEQTKMLS